MFIQELAKAHGGLPAVGTGNGYLFADGSAYSGRWFQPAPTDEQERLRCIRQYHKVLLACIQSDLKALEAALNPGQQRFSTPFTWPMDDWRSAHYGPPLMSHGMPDGEKAIRHLRVCPIRV